MATLVTLTGQNWLITPAVNLPSVGPVAEPNDVLRGHVNGDQLWLLVLTGVGRVLFSGPSSTGWATETVTIVPDVQAPLAYALDSLVVPLAGTHLGFDLVMWAPFAAVSGLTSVEEGFSVNGGFALDTWRPTSFDPALIDSAGNSVSQVFQGINVDISVHYPSEIIGLSYNITLLGRIVHLGHPVFETSR